MDCDLCAIEKILSPNDLGSNGSHQAGMLIPKRKEVLSFFPKLDESQTNPRISLSFKEKDGGAWTFKLIYYNNKLRGGTRNEYRLTGMTEFFRRSNLKAGDILILRHDDEYQILYTRSSETLSAIADDGIIRLRLNSEWHIINF